MFAYKSFQPGVLFLQLAQPLGVRDVHAPAQQWGGESKRTDIRLVTVAAKAGPVASNQGPKTVADFGFADAPQLDYLLVPGGIGAIPLVQDATALDWLRARAKKAKLVMSSF